MFLIHNFCMHQANGFYNSKCSWLIPLVCQRAYGELMELRMCVVGWERGDWEGASKGVRCNRSVPVTPWSLSFPGFKSPWQPKSCCWFWKCDGNMGCRFCRIVCLRFWMDYSILIYNHCWGLMTSAGSHGSSSMLLLMKAWRSGTLWTTFIGLWPYLLLSYIQSVVVEISLQSHWYIAWQLVVFLTSSFVKYACISVKISRAFRAEGDDWRSKWYRISTQETGQRVQKSYITCFSHHCLSLQKLLMSCHRISNLKCGLEYQTLEYAQIFETVLCFQLWIVAMITNL